MTDGLNLTETLAIDLHVKQKGQLSEETNASHQIGHFDIGRRPDVMNLTNPWKTIDVDKRRN